MYDKSYNINLKNLISDLIGYITAVGPRIMNPQVSIADVALVTAGAGISAWKNVEIKDEEISKYQKQFEYLTDKAWKYTWNVYKLDQLFMPSGLRKKRMDIPNWRWDRIIKVSDEINKSIKKGESSEGALAIDRSGFKESENILKAISEEIHLKLKEVVNNDNYSSLDRWNEDRLIRTSENMTRTFLGKMYIEIGDDEILRPYRDHMEMISDLKDIRAKLSVQQKEHAELATDILEIRKMLDMIIMMMQEQYGIKDKSFEPTDIDVTFLNSIGMLADNLWINWKTGYLASDLETVMRGFGKTEFVVLSPEEIRLLSIIAQGEGALVKWKEIGIRRRVSDEGGSDEGGLMDNRESYFSDFRIKLSESWTCGALLSETESRFRTILNKLSKSQSDTDHSNEYAICNPSDDKLVQNKSIQGIPSNNRTHIKQESIDKCDSSQKSYNKQSKRKIIISHEKPFVKSENDIDHSNGVMGSRIKSYLESDAVDWHRNANDPFYEKELSNRIDQLLYSYPQLHEVLKKEENGCRMILKADVSSYRYAEFNSYSNDKDKKRLKVINEKKMCTDSQAWLRRYYDQECRSFNRISNGLASNIDIGDNRYVGSEEAKIFGNYSMAEIYVNAYAIEHFSSDEPERSQKIEFKQSNAEVMLDYVEKWFQLRINSGVGYSWNDRSSGCTLDDHYGRVLVLHGQPGDGKTTFCKKAVYAHCREGWLKTATQVLRISLNQSDHYNTKGAEKNSLGSIIEEHFFLDRTFCLKV